MAAGRSVSQIGQLVNGFGIYRSSYGDRGLTDVHLVRCPARPRGFLKPLRQLIQEQRTANVVTLGDIATAAAQVIQQAFVVHTFGLDLRITAGALVWTTAVVVPVALVASLL